MRADESANSARASSSINLLCAALGIGMVGVAFYLLHVDLINRERAEEATHRLAAIVESSNDAIIGKSLDGTIVSWNAGARRIYGYDADEVIGKPVTILDPKPGAEISEQLDRSRQGLRTDPFETQRVRKDGQLIDIALSVSQIKDASGSVIGTSAIARDITERKLLQREVLETASREQRRIGQDLHDGIGQELTGLAMMAERLAENLAAKSLPESNVAAKIVDALEEALAHVRALSKGLLPVEVDSEGLMMALGDLAARTNDLRGVRVTFECEQPVSILDNQVATHLYRMSQEAITNAIKHGHAHNITIVLSADSDLITLEIVDDGVGFSGRVDEMAGNGLRIMRHRAEMIGANWSISPVEPKGTEVKCTLRPKQLSLAPR